MSFGQKIPQYEGRRATIPAGDGLLNIPLFSVGTFVGTRKTSCVKPMQVGEENGKREKCGNSRSSERK